MAEKKVVFITGGGAGLGKATASEMARRGYAVSILDLHKETADKAAAEIIAAGGEAIGFGGDISSIEDMQAAVNGTIEKYGRIDAVHANAGEQLVEGDIEHTSIDDWKFHMNININGTFLTAKLTIPHLVETKGALLVTSSDAGPRPTRDIIAYNTSKAAVINIAKSIALDYGRKGVRANIICPYNIETEHLKNEWKVSDEVDKAWRDAVPLGRYGTPEEVAKVAAHLLTDDSSYTSGLVYMVTGAADVGYYINIW